MYTLLESLHGSGSGSVYRCIVVSLYRFLVVAWLIKVLLFSLYSYIRNAKDSRCYIWLAIRFTYVSCIDIFSAHAFSKQKPYQ